MIPLNLTSVGNESIVQKVNGDADLRHHLANLGIIPGEPITLLSCINGSVMCKVKESRIAISEEMARKIFCE